MEHMHSISPYLLEGARGILNSKTSHQVKSFKNDTWKMSSRKKTQFVCNPPLIISSVRSSFQTREVYSKVKFSDWILVLFSAVKNEI